MEIRMSPYNSPFIPCVEEGVYWLGLEHQHGFHTQHVNEFCKSKTFAAEQYLNLRSSHVRALSVQNSNELMSDLEYRETYELFTKYGVQAAGRRLGLCE